MASSWILPNSQTNEYFFGVKIGGHLVRLNFDPSHFLYTESGLTIFTLPTEWRPTLMVTFVAYTYDWSAKKEGIAELQVATSGIIRLWSTTLTKNSIINLRAQCIYNI